jgi:hypothetical protein
MILGPKFPVLAGKQKWSLILQLKMAQTYEGGML